MNKEPRIINDILRPEFIKKRNLLDYFQRRVLEECAVTKDFLLDVGSGSGRFLYHNYSIFRDAMGIEITDECVTFAREKLGLKVEKDIEGFDKIISVATFWHSLEHMKDDAIDKFLNVISVRSSPDTRIIVSLPNNNSLQSLLFKKDFAYYDKRSHIHQFSLDALDGLMDKYNFERTRSFYSFPYAVFGWLQGLLNKFNPIHDYLYYRKKRGETFRMNKRGLQFYDAYNFLLAIFFIAPALFLSFYDFLCLEKGGVITACYGKKKN